MPRIRGFTPAWLSKPAPGYNLFAASGDESQSPFPPSNATPKPGPRRTIARSGTQVFVAVGKEVRWADLVDLKERWLEKTNSGHTVAHIKREGSSESGDDDGPVLKAAAEDGYAGFRTIRVPVGSDISQLVVSPQAEYLAILTSHTIRILAVPDLAHLSSRSNDVIKPKSWTLGPTTHVLNRSPLASALWHPLGVNGSTIVTVTTDAVVRVWELSPINRWSFDTPTMTIDLQKLADGTSLDQNFTARDTKSKGFSPDSLEMDVASACFAARGSGGWSPMTLWLAMREGDVYALCPLLPTRWSPPPALIPSLSVSIVENLAAIEDDPEVSAQDKLLAQQQLDWMADLDNQEPAEARGQPGELPALVYARPARPGAVPKLQGPFDLDLNVDSEADSDLELTDIFVIGRKLDLEELMTGEDEELATDDIDQEGLSLNIICLLSSSGQLRICLDLDGVQAQWLPPRNRPILGDEATEIAPSLVNFQTIDTLTNREKLTDDGWPMFSPDVTSRYAFYITHSSSITYISLSPWVFRLESEFQSPEAGSDFRIDVLVKGQSSTRERLYTSPTQTDAHLSLTASVAIQDPDLGYFLLSATMFEPLALVFEVPEYDYNFTRTVSPGPDTAAVEVRPLDFYEPRPAFQPSHVFEQSTELPTILGQLRSSRHKALVNQEVRLSPITLQIFTDIHSRASHESLLLGEAASELFRRLHKMQGELKEQITKANEVKTRVEAISGGDQDEPESAKASVERRLQAARARNEAISQRLEKMRRTAGKATSRELSDKEKAWFKEVSALDASLDVPAASAESDTPSRRTQPGKRFAEAKALGQDLVAQAKQLGGSSNGDGDDDGSGHLNGGHEAQPASPDRGMLADLRKSRVNQVHTLLERETALVDAVKSRLERLALSGQVG